MAVTDAPDADIAHSYFPGHGDERYRVLSYELELHWRPAGGRLSGRARLGAVAGQGDGPLGEVALDFAPFRIKWVLVDGAPAEYTQGDGKLLVRPSVPPLPGFRFTVEVRYAGEPQPVDTRWGALGWVPLADGALVASRPTGAPSWFPCNDRPADKATYRISVTAPAAYTVLATGTERSHKTKAGRTVRVFEQSAPTAAHLVSVQIGRYAQAWLAKGPVPQRAAMPARLRSRFTHELARQPRMMELFEELFGPYPFAGYDVVLADTALTAPVVAQGLTVFGTQHRGERLLAHALAHQWFGASLTAAEWRDSWLSEGFATYAGWLWSERCGDGGPGAAELAAETDARLRARAHLPRLDDPGPRKLFDDRLGQRGALLLHELRGELGDLAFFELLRDWAARHRHGTVTTRDFADLARRYSVGPLTELFEQPLPR
jgi:aminopeptidase N